MLNKDEDGDGDGVDVKRARRIDDNDVFCQEKRPDLQTPLLVTSRFCTPATSRPPSTSSIFFYLPSITSQPQLCMTDFGVRNIFPSIPISCCGIGRFMSTFFR